MKKLLCYFGLHNWLIYSDRIKSVQYVEVIKHCQTCGKFKKEIYIKGERR
jgi:hypothetical protein